MKGDEILLAYAVGRILGVTGDYVISAVGRRCEWLGLWDIAMMMYQTMREPSKETQLGCGRYWGRKRDAEELYMVGGDVM